MHKISRSQLRAWAIGHLKTKQGGLCPLCNKPISLSVSGAKSDYVVDHDHETGEIRGVLHRSCNSGEGKACNALGQWVAKSNSYAAIIPVMERLLAYLKQGGCGIIYPDHKTAEQRDEQRRVKANQAAAMRRARLRLAKETK